MGGMGEYVGVGKAGMVIGAIVGGLVGNYAATQKRMQKKDRAGWAMAAAAGGAIWGMLIQNRDRLSNPGPAMGGCDEVGLSGECF
jgi:RsiW-degrading membrane proteinase PrsW (M82 family)